MTTLYKKMGKSIGYWKISVTDNAELEIVHAKKLDGEETRRIVPVKAKNVGRANETTELQQAHLEAQSRIKKQLDKGYLPSVEEAENFVSVSPVLATVVDKVRLTEGDFENAYLQPKLNGHRCLYRDGKLWSRGGKVINLPHILEAIHDQGLEGTELDGELYIHGESLQRIGSYIKRLQDDSYRIEYHIYDCPGDKSFACRFRVMKSVDYPLWLTPTSRVNTLEQALDLTTAFVKAGYEGGMLRIGVQGYEYGKRSRNLLKLKTYKDTEVTVIGHEPAQPNGELESVRWICSNPFGGEDFKVLANGTWEQVHEQALNADQYVGKTLTLKYFELSEGNVPQQPIALNWREDL